MNKKLICTMVVALLLSGLVAPSSEAKSKIVKAPNAKTSLQQSADSTNLTVAVVDKDLNTKLIPKFAFKILKYYEDKDSGETKLKEDPELTVVTDFNGKAVFSLPPGDYLIQNESPLEFEEKKYNWKYKFSIKPKTPISIELSNNNAEIIANENNKRIISDKIALFEEFKNSVVAIESDSGSGSGFIIDESGLILTNHHVVNDSVQYRVLFDEKVKVKATLVADVPEKDIAILLVNPKTLPAAKALKLANPDKDKPLAVAGEKVIAIGSPVSQNKIMMEGVVSKVKDDEIISDVNVNRSNSGGPLFNSLGEVIGITTVGDISNQGGPDIAGIINITKAYPVIENAKLKIVNEKINPPDPSLLPCFPEISFPTEALKLSINQKFKINDYIYDANPFTVTIYSPPLYYSKSDEINLKLFKLKRQKNKDKQDAELEASQDLTINSDNTLLKLRKWKKDVVEFKPVLVIEATPQMSLTGGSIAKLIFCAAVSGAVTGTGGYAFMTPGLDYKFKGDFYDMKLFVNGELVEPIRRGKALTKIAFSDRRKKIQDQTHSGYFMYSPELLIPKQSNTQNKIEIQLFEKADPLKPITITLKEQTITKLLEEFQPYFHEKEKTNKL